MPYYTDWTQPSTVHTRRRFGLQSMVKPPGTPLPSVYHTHLQGPIPEEAFTNDVYPASVDQLQTPLTGSAAAYPRPLWYGDYERWHNVLSESLNPSYNVSGWSGYGATTIWDFDGYWWEIEYRSQVIAAFQVANPNAYGAFLEWEGHGWPGEDFAVFGTSSNRQLIVEQVTDYAVEYTERGDDAVPANVDPGGLAIRVMRPEALVPDWDGVAGYNDQITAWDDDTTPRVQYAFPGPALYASIADLYPTDPVAHQLVDRLASPGLVGGTRTDVVDLEPWFAGLKVKFERDNRAGKRWGTEGLYLAFVPGYAATPSDLSSPWVGTDTAKYAQVRGDVFYEHDWTPPRYRIRYNLTVTNAPEVVYPRDDGLATGSADQCYPIPRAYQAGNDTFGGYW